MGFIIKKLLALALGLTVLHSQGYAQNVERLEEEEVKEQERISKYREYLNQRESEEKALLEKPVTVEELENKNLVEVEPNNILPSDLVTSYALVPYKVRRPRWGNMITATYSLYKPINYESDFDPDSFKNLYGSAETPFIELSYAYKWNFILGSVGGEVSYGMYSNDADDAALGEATLDLKIIRAGVKCIADNLFYEPTWAPYFIGGAYTVLFKETQPGVSFDGTTGVAFYYGAGILFQLGWIDPTAAVEAYTESGIENTYLFAEARQMLASGEAQDPDFSTDLDLNFGVSVEF